MISRKMVCRSLSFSGPGLLSATLRRICASRSGRNTGAMVSAFTWPTSCATLPRRPRSSRICASIASICSRRGWSLSVIVQRSALSEVVQIIDQGLHALDRHRVVDRCPHTADGLVALQLRQPARPGAGQELVVEGFVAQVKGYVHARTAFGRHAIPVE